MSTGDELCRQRLWRKHAIADFKMRDKDGDAIGCWTPRMGKRSEVKVQTVQMKQTVQPSNLILH